MKPVTLHPIEVEAAPRRLVTSDDEVGRVLRLALEQTPRGAESALPAMEFRKATERLRAQRLLLWPALAAAAVGCLWYVGQSARDAWLTSPDPRIVAEPLAQDDTRQATPTQERAQPAQEERRERSAAPLRVGGTVARRPAGLAQPNAKTSEPLAASSTRTPCPELSRSGSYEQAAECYAEQARGSGVGAELAWLEKARLERRALHAPQRALDTLSGYAQRFPAGALRPEASLTRVELLDELGQTSEALVLIDALLVEGLVPARTAELHAMRARLLARSGRCVEAEQALGDARRLGASEKYSAAVREHCAAAQGER